MTDQEMWKNSVEMARLFAIRNCRDSALTDNAEWLAKARLIPKPKWAPWPKSSTTVSSKEVWINENFTGGDIVSRAAHLIHESEHLLQYRDVGRLSFLWQYATSPSFRLWAEVGATKASLRWQRGLVPSWSPNFSAIAEHIFEAYSVSRALAAQIALDLADWWVITKPKN